MYVIIIINLLKKQRVSNLGELNEELVGKQKKLINYFRDDKNQKKACLTIFYSIKHIKNFDKHIIRKINFFFLQYAIKHER